MAQYPDLFVGASNGDNVRRFDGATGAFKSDFTSGGPVGGGYSCPVFGPQGDLFVKEFLSDGAVRRYDGVTGQFKATIVHNIGTSYSAIVFGPDMNLYVGGPYSARGRIDRYTPSGQFLGPFVLSGSGGLTDPGPMRFGLDGNLYVGQTNSTTAMFKVLRYDGQTGAFIDEFITTGSGGLGHADILFGPDGNLYTADSSSHSILRFDGNTGAFIDTFIWYYDELFDELRDPWPWGLAFGGDNNLYVANHGGYDSVMRFDGKTGQFIDTFASPTFSAPTYITFANLPSPPSPPSPDPFEKISTLSLMARILFGVANDGGGVIILPGRGPIPVPPWQGMPFPLWESLSPAEQDVLTGLVTNKLGSLINNNEARTVIQKAASDLLVKEMRRLLES